MSRALLGQQPVGANTTHRSSSSSLPRSSILASPSITVPIAIPRSLIRPPCASTNARRRAYPGSAKWPRSTNSNGSRAGPDSVRGGLWAVVWCQQEEKKKSRSGHTTWRALIPVCLSTKPVGLGPGATHEGTRRRGSRCRPRRGPLPKVIVSLCARAKSGVLTT